MHRTVARQLVFGTVLSLIALGTVACEAGGTGEGDGTTRGEPIKVGAILPLTGDGGSYGAGMEVALNVAVNEVNEAGGPMGRTFEVKVVDDQTNATQGVLGAQRLINVDGVDAIVGTWSSTVTTAVFEVTSENNIVHLNVSGSPTITELQTPEERTLFRMNASDADLQPVVADAMIDDGIGSVAILGTNEVGVEESSAAFREAFERLGGRVLESITVPPGQPSYSSAVDRILAANADLIFLACYAPEAAIIMKRAYQVNPDARFIVGSWSVDDQVIRVVGAEALEGTLAYDLIGDPESAAYERLASAFEEEAGDDISTNVYATHVYDSIIALALAIEKAQTLDAKAVGVALREITNDPGQPVSTVAEGLELLRNGQDIHFFGAGGPLELDENGDMSPVVGIFTITDGSLELTKSASGRP
jgi:branched-chain amino acid transport system substrate-binding protein